MIRVLRVIEYIYKDGERFAYDQLRWTEKHNSNDMTMQSAIVSITPINEEGRVWGND